MNPPMASASRTPKKTRPVPPPHARPPNGLEDRISHVGGQLTDSLRRVLDELPGRPQRPQQLARLLGLNRDISGRVLSAAKATDPYSATHIVPGPEPLRKLIQAARRKNVSLAILNDTERAIQDFESLIDETAGDRPALNAIISSLLPDARQKFELAAKQTAFKGASLLKGAMADLWLHTAIVFPSAQDPQRNDVAHVFGTIGLRRLRPNVTVKFTYRQYGTPTETWHTLSGQPPEQADGRELDQFCTLPPAPLDQTLVGNGVIYALGAGDDASGGVGPRSAVDKLLAEVRPRAMSKYAANRPRNKKSLFVAPSVPVKLLNFDMLLHRDVYPVAQPTLLVYDTAVEGMASVNDPARDADRLLVHESLTVLPHDVSAWQIPEVPKYLAILQHVIQRLGHQAPLELDQFRGIRCRIQYPLYGSQACMAFDAPAK